MSDSREKNLSESRQLDKLIIETEKQLFELASEEVKKLYLEIDFLRERQLLLTQDY